MDKEEKDQSTHQSEEQASEELTPDSILDEIIGVNTDEFSGVQPPSSTSEEEGANDKSPQDKSQDEETKEEAEDSEEVKDESKQPPEESKDWQQEYEKAEQRRRTTESNYDKQKHQIQALELELQKFKDQQKQETKQPEVAPKISREHLEQRYKEKVQQGDAQAVWDLVLELHDEVNHLRSNGSTSTDKLKEVLQDPNSLGIIQEVVENARLNHEREVFEKTHDDYTDVMKVFVQAQETNPETNDKWIQKGKTVAAAYEIGKELLEIQEITKDPTAWKAKQLELLKQEIPPSDPKVKSNGVPKTLAQNQGKSRSAKTAKHYADADQVLDEIIANPGLLAPH